MEVREKYRFQIEGDVIVNPEGWKDFELRLKRDDEIAGLLVSSTNNFTFKGNGYDLLKQRFDDNFNDKANVSIEILQDDDTYLLQYNGVAILTNILFNLEKRTADTTIEDASFQGAISGNKNIKAFLDTDFTKNNEQITALTVFNMDYFAPNGSFTPIRLRKMYRYKDALDFLVRFMTDDLVKGVQSAYLDDVNNFGGASLLYLTTGEGVRVANPTAPNISFSQLITFLSKTHDLTFDFVTDSNGDPVMRIEEREFFFGATNSDTIRDIVDLTVEIDETKIGSHIEIGNNNTFPTGNCSATARFFSFQSEDYGLGGKGNIDNLIDLKTDFITDSNVIEDIVANNNDSFEDDIVVVMGNVSGAQATRFQSTQYCSNNFFYNLEFTNDNIINRTLSAIPGSVVKFLQGGTTPAKITRGLDELFTIFTFPTPPLIFDAFQQSIPITIDNLISFVDVVYDVGSNYVTTPQTFYEVPFEGTFSFEATVVATFSIIRIFKDDQFAVVAAEYRIAIERRDASLTILKEQVLSSPISAQFFQQIGEPQSPLFTRRKVRTVQATMDCDTSDRIVVRVLHTSVSSANVLELAVNVPPLPSSFFKCLGAAEDNGVFKVFDPLVFRARQYKFQKNLPLTRTDNIRANSRSSIIINELSDISLDKTTWIEEMRNNIETGVTQFTTIN